MRDHEKQPRGQKGRISIGTSNGFIPGNRASFPEAYRSASRLHYYGTIFNSIEINRSFYKTPRRVTVEKWAKEVPAGFQITLKVSKAVTHVKNLESDLSVIGPFIDAANGAGEKKGCLLLQFPAKVTLDHYDKVEMILHEIREQDTTAQWRIAIEFRHASWYTGETTEMLNEYNAAIVLHDFAKAKMFELMTDPGFVYIRFHGPKGDYKESYAEKFLQAKAAAITGWLNDGRDVYAYFNNTKGNAFENAMVLQSLVKPDYSTTKANE